MFEMIFKRKSSFVQFSRQLCSKVTKSEKWQSVIGLEVHAQILSNSKLFSGASTKFQAPVNSNVALLDCSMPGTLPVLNKRCVEAGVLAALALNCTVNPVSYFDRKHYFYADLPVGYQITQQRAPLANNGRLEFQVFMPQLHKVPYTTSVRIKQLQLEQDSGKSLHDIDRSLVDLNRAGVPLMELVFEPDLKDGEEAASLIKELILILQRTNTCSCKMEEGALRVDANVSINKPGEPLGTRTEIKNIGSVRGVANAIKYEIQRQIKVKEAGGTIVNETRAWDAVKKVTIAMRDKEVVQDYRYMPEPNLPPLHVAMGGINHGCVHVDEIKDKIPELPYETRQRLINSYDLTALQAMTIVNDNGLLEIFELAMKTRKISAKSFALFLMNDLYAVLNKNELETQDLKCDPNHIGEIYELFENQKINRETSKLLVDEIIKGNTKNPSQIVSEQDLFQITDLNELTKLCEDIMAENEKAVNDYKRGKTKAIKALLRAVFNKSNGKANMGSCDKILKDLLAK